MPRVGQTVKLNEQLFRSEGWSLVTQTQAIKSVLKIVNAESEDYQALYILIDKEETIAPNRLKEVWAGWARFPVNGSLFVCLYGKES